MGVRQAGREQAGYLPALDGLRGVAVILVFLVHTYADYLPGGFVGVDLFFAISGYLITDLLLKESAAFGRPSVSRFYLRRALRILPALFVMVAATAILLPWTITGGSDSGVLNTAAALFGFMNWLRAFTPASGLALGHTWSLGVEEQFYAIWVLCILACSGQHARRTVFALALGGIVLVTVWRGHLLANGASAARLFNGLDTRGDALLVGCVLAAIPARSGVLAAAYSLWPLPIAGLTIIAFTTAWNAPWLLMGGFTVVALCSGWLVHLASQAEGTLVRPLSNRWLLWLGKRSYSFYLWHLPVIAALSSSGMQRSLWILPALALSMLLAAASYHFVELPFLHLKTGFTIQRARLAKPAPDPL